MPRSRRGRGIGVDRNGYTLLGRRGTGSALSKGIDGTGHEAKLIGEPAPASVQPDDSVGGVAKQIVSAVWNAPVTLNGCMGLQLCAGTSHEKYARTMAELTPVPNGYRCWQGNDVDCGLAAMGIVPSGSGASAGLRAGARLVRDLSRARRTGVAAIGGAAAVRTGQAGEAAVRSMYDIGPKASAYLAGRTRISDGLTDTTVSEVKNVARQSFTVQLRDSLAYARRTGRTFDLYVRPDTYLTGPLRDVVARGTSD